MIQGPPLVVGEKTREVLEGLGYSAAEIAELHAAKVAGVWAPGEPLLSGPRRFIGYKPEVYDGKVPPPGSAKQTTTAESA